MADRNEEVNKTPADEEVKEEIRDDQILNEEEEEEEIEIGRAHV